MSDLKLKVDWSRGLTKEQTTELRADILSCPVFRKRLLTLLQEKDDLVSKRSFSAENLDKANWALRQAETCGYRRALNEIISLIP